MKKVVNIQNFLFLISENLMRIYTRVHIHYKLIIVLKFTLFKGLYRFLYKIMYVIHTVI